MLLVGCSNAGFNDVLEQSYDISLTSCNMGCSIHSEELMKSSINVSAFQIILLKDDCEKKCHYYNQLLRNS